MINFDNDPHRRYNPMLDEWVLVSPHRTKRPWQGQQEGPAVEVRPTYDEECYLCPGNTRANGEVNPTYAGTYSFLNDFSALLPSDGPDDLEAHSDNGSLLKARKVSGECRVLCFSPRHDLSLSQLSELEIESVVALWADQITDLGQKYRWVQIFENRGAAMGASNPHPHGQVWASDFIPTLIERESFHQKQYFEAHGGSLLVDLVKLEVERAERIVAATDHWVLVVPFWATWPFEYLLIPRRPVTRLTDLRHAERRDLAHILKQGLSAYDGLFQNPFPYSMGWHGAPTDGQDHPHWQLHAHFYPPLLRSATVRKFMVGYEMLAESQRDLSPESAAQRLREVLSPQRS
jgi:UDPglucose--hexose-1-phosphate uridylyltransferase